MKSEKQKMIMGELYNAMDEELVRDRLQARFLLKRYNDSAPDQIVTRQQILNDLIPEQGSGLYIEPPFYCDYGANIKIGNKVYFNFSCTILDVMQVTIGDNTLFGPSVQIYTAMHPIDWKERSSGLEFAKPVSIGSHVWVGGGAIICPGVSIGDRSIIGAGSVVTRDIPDNVFAAGNPCKIIKSL